MGASHTETFVAAADAVDAQVTRTSADRFAGALDDVLTPPAVGTPLPFDGVDYTDTAVEPDPTGAALAAAETGVTAAAHAIADYGSVVLRETGAGEELLGLYPDTHVVVLAASDVLPDMPAAIETLGETIEGAGDDAIIATGPSATADMGAVVTGVHGPRAVHVLLLEDR